MVDFIYKMYENINSYRISFESLAVFLTEGMINIHNRLLGGYLTTSDLQCVPAIP